MNRKKRILIVDDDRQISKGVSMRLRAVGYDTSVANDGAEGVDAANEHPPDAIIMDVRMPVMDGLTAMKELKRNPKTNGIPIVVLSASVVDEDAAFDGGARFFLRKPFVSTNLVEAVNSATATAAVCS